MKVKEYSVPLDREQAVKQYAPLVKRIAYHLMARLPASVQVEDLIQVGLMGLMDALDRYDGTQGAQFESYATQRIRGAMLDELRDSDWLPRHVRKNARTIEQAIHHLEHRFGRHPVEHEIAGEMGLSLPDYQQMLCDARGAQLVYVEDFTGDDNEDFFERYVARTEAGPLDMLQNEAFRERLIDAIDELPEREKSVMGMYYEQEMNLKEIGAVLGVSESRVCQIHGQAVSRLRAKLKDWR
jgi:RNA polymerase sigma factor for flagellar operon FliA